MIASLRLIAGLFLVASVTPGLALAAEGALPEAGVFEEAATALAKANPPEGCILNWTATRDSAAMNGGTATEEWTLTAIERFRACYRKGDYGVETDKRLIAAGTETPVRVRCTGPVADGSANGDPDCALVE